MRDQRKRHLFRDRHSLQLSIQEHVHGSESERNQCGLKCFREKLKKVNILKFVGYFPVQLSFILKTKENLFVQLNMLFPTELHGESFERKLKPER